MQTGISWEGVAWGAKSGHDAGPSKRSRALLTLLLLASIAGVLVAFVVFASAADARSCRSFAHTPYKSSAYRVHGEGDLGCTSAGEAKALDVYVYKHRNNWPDPKVCDIRRVSRAEDFGAGCTGPFKRGTGGLRLRGYYYTYTVGGGGHDYSPRKYLVPG